MVQAHAFGISYVLGEREANYRDCESFAQSGMPDNPAMWGWGAYYETQKELCTLFAEAARKTIEKSGICESQIDAVFLCSATFSAYQGSHCDFLRKFLEGAGLVDDTIVRGITLDGCSTLLSTIDLARATVISGTHSNVLVISADSVQKHQPRFVSYALFSDGAAACIVSKNHRTDGIEIVSAANASRIEMMSNSAPYCNDLANLTNQRALSSAGLASSDISIVFCGNLFLPLTLLRESEAGSDEDKIFTANIQKKGHCFSADPLINLCDSIETQSLKHNDYVLLAADSPGSRTTLIGRYRGA